MSHVTDAEIGLFLTGRLKRATFLRLLRHLVDDCAACRARLARFENTPEVNAGTLAFPEIDSRYDGAIKRALAKALDATPRWSEDHRLIKQILGKGNLATEILRERLDDWSFIEALIALSREARFREPRKMLDLAAEALEAALALDRQRYTPGIIGDLQAAAWAELGNAYRVNEDYDRAEHAFAQAHASLNDGTGDPLALARLLDLQASLHTAQRRLPEAIQLLDKVFRLFDSVGEHHLAGRALISKGISTRCGGRAREAVDLLRRGMEMLEPGRDPQLLAIGQQNLLDSLVDCGEFREAKRLLLTSGLRQQFAAEPINLLRLRWVEGKVHAGLGKLWRAQSIFLELRESFQQGGLEYETALAGLELLDIWLRDGRTQGASELAREVLTVFEDLGVESEALRAVRFLDEACRHQQASAALVQRVVHFLRRLEWEPRLQFAT